MAHKRFKSMAIINFDSDQMHQANLNLEALQKNEMEMKSPKIGMYKFQLDKTGR